MSSDSVFSLEDAPERMGQVEANDLPGLARLHGMLSDLSSSSSLSPAVAELVNQSAQKIKDLILEENPDPVTALVAASRLLEAAIKARDAPSAERPQYPPPEKAAAIDAVCTIPAPEDSKIEQPIASFVLSSSFPPPATESDVSELLPPDADRDLIASFVTESRENLESAEASLLTMETDPNNLEAVNTVFRAFHTLKGTSGFLGLTRINQLAHRAESLLSRIRDREIRCTGGYADLALRSADLLNELVQSVQNVLGGETMSKPDGYNELMRVLADPEAAGVNGDPSEAPVPHLRVGDILVAGGKASREEVESAAASQGRHKIGEALLMSRVSSVTDLVQALRTQRRMDGGERTADSTVRVRTDRLDRLIDMVGELVIAQSIVAQDETVLESSHLSLLGKVAHAGKIVRELQDLSMSMRMVPLKATFQKMARLVRDLAHKSGKRVEFLTQGEDTEIARNMVDFIGDALVHMIRNAIDHGIETPEVRASHGKSGTGTMRLAAYHAGGSVVVELADDGKGLDRDKILKKALEKGLLSSDKALSESEVFSLICAPGISTAEQITDVSGRGVGMDVVHRNIEALRGRIEIASQPGQGTTFTLRLPLMVAVTDGMLVRVGP